VEQTAEVPVPIGPEQWNMQVVWLEADDLVPNAENPNQQDDETFNGLVGAIQAEGWTDPVKAVWDEARGKYEIVGGEHRWRAAKVLASKVPTIVLPRELWDRDRRDWVMVKDNLLKGRLNPEKFAQLYERMAKRYDAETLQGLMGFTSEEAFKKVYKEARAALPPELQAALDAAKDEIKTIDDLSMVLNRLFREHGETLPSDFMVFSWGGKDVLWVRADKRLFERMTDIAERVDAAGDSLTRVLNQLLDDSEVRIESVA
jgi:hypothetical protein